MISSGSRSVSLLQTAASALAGHKFRQNPGHRQHQQPCRSFTNRNNPFRTVTFRPTQCCLYFKNTISWQRSEVCSGPVLRNPQSFRSCCRTRRKVSLHRVRAWPNDTLKTMTLRPTRVSTLATLGIVLGIEVAGAQAVSRKKAPIEI